MLILLAHGHPFFYGGVNGSIDGGNCLTIMRENACQASEAQQVLGRLVSITKSRGVSMANTKVLDNYGNMVSASP